MPPKNRIDLSKINAVANNATMQTSNKNETTIPVNMILPNPYQPRFSEENIDELAASIEKDGLLQPIAVKKNSDGTYIVIAGHRRLAATKSLNLKEIKVHIVNDVDDKKLYTLAMIENVQREQLNPIEVAIAVDNSIKQGFCTSQDEVAELIGKSKVWVSKIRSLLKLDEKIIADLLENNPKIGAETLAELAKVEQSKQFDIYLDIPNMENAREQIKEIIKSQKQKESVSRAKLSFDISSNLDKKDTQKALNEILSLMEEEGIETILKRIKGGN